MLSKSANNKKCAPKLAFFNEKKIREIWIILDTDMDFESQILAHFDSLPIIQNSKFLLILRQKSF